MNLKTTKFNDLSIKWKLLIICVLLVSIPVVAAGTISYKSAEQETFRQIEERLQEQATQTEMFVSSVYSEIQTKKEDVNTQAESMVEAQAQAVYSFITKWTGTNTDLIEAVDEISVGETGYIWIVDYEGITVTTKNKELIGADMSTAEDANGKLFIQESLNKGKELSGNNVAFVDYAWQNPGEPEPRDKIIGVINIPSKEWIVGIGTYYDELVDTTFETEKMNALKDELSNIVVGKSGYLFILDEEGNYVLSKNQQRNGENIWEAQDADGNYFIQDIINTAESLPEGKTAVTYYPWQNEGKSSSRLKLAAYTYFPDENWVIASSAYQEDFLDGLKTIQVTTIAIAIAAIVIGSIVAYFFALALTKPIKKVVTVLKSNDLSKRCNIDSKDEVGTIGGAVDAMLENLAVPVKEMADKSHKIAAGDLTVDLNVKAEGDVGRLVDGFKEMITHLQNVIGGIKNSAVETASTAEELSSSAEEVNASMEEVSSTIQQVAEGSQNTAKDSENMINQAKQASENSSQGQQAAQEVSSKMQMIKTTTQEGADKIGSLGEKSKEIGNIVDTINQISEQTNLLALNAAIEAARAGEAGRGFAVVADEVRKLAEESGQATQQISDLIKGIQGEIDSAVTSMNENTKQVEDGSQGVEEAMKAFETLPQVIATVNQSAEQVSSVAQENASGAEEVSASIEQVTSSMQQVTDSSQQMAEISNNLQSIVNQFKINEQ